jgi:hypothetical protein
MFVVIQPTQSTHSHSCIQHALHIRAGHGKKSKEHKNNTTHNHNINKAHRKNPTENKNAHWRTLPKSLAAQSKRDITAYSKMRRKLYI